MLFSRSLGDALIWPLKEIFVVVKKWFLGNHLVLFPLLRQIRDLLVRLSSSSTLSEMKWMSYIGLKFIQTHEIGYESLWL
jgi:hypothetical protein